MNCPRVSVVIPCYNSLGTIVRCLDSVLAQTESVYEVLVVDDGSSDGTYTVAVNRLVSSGIRHQIFKQRNAGPSVARNRGISMATGDVVAFLDSDDMWASWHIRNLLQNYDDRIGFVAAQKGVFSFKSRLGTVGYLELLFRNRIQSSTMVVSRDLLNRFQFNINQKYSEDYRLWLEIAEEIGHLPLSEAISASAVDGSQEFLSTGLSSRLFLMEKGELSNYFFLHRTGRIAAPLLIVTVIWSLARFALRIVKREMSRLVR